MEVLKPCDRDLVRAEGEAVVIPSTQGQSPDVSVGAAAYFGLGLTALYTCGMPCEGQVAKQNLTSTTHRMPNSNYKKENKQGRQEHRGGCS